MKKPDITIITRTLIVLLLASLTFLPNARAQGTAFTYQGSLNATGAPANGNYDLSFSLYNTATGGSSIAGPVTSLATGVTNGLFSVTIDFGSAFTGTTNWLDISVRTNGSATYTNLTPRQQITPTPFAIFAESAKSSGLIGAISSNALPGFQAPYATIGGGFQNSVTTSNSTIGGGYQNQATATGATVVGGYQNTASGIAAFVGGGGYDGLTFQGNTASGFATSVVGGIGNMNLGPISFIGGGTSNTVGASADNSVIGGGERNLIIGSDAEQVWGTIGGGLRNRIGTNTQVATIAGGYANTNVALYGTIGGGGSNVVVGTAATVAGGFYNGTSGNYAVISGGRNNTNSGNFSMIPGGTSNSAVSLAFAAGNSAKATNIGSFVWADAQNVPFSSTTSNQFNVRASGGIVLVTGGTGATLDGPFSANVGGIGNVAIVNEDGVVPGLTATSSNSYSGHMRFRNALEVFPNTAQTSAGLVDVRNTNGSQTIILDGGTGSVSAQSFSGNGSGLTGISASGLTGILPISTLPSFYSPFNVVGGGENNNLTGNHAVIGGGGFNTVTTGSYATIPGGASNTTSGNYAFAAGNHAQAVNNGAFVWSDGTGTTTASATDNSVTMRASGGYRFFTTTGNVGVSLATGGTSFSTISDKNVKKNFTAVDSANILDRLATIPVQKWNYQWEPDAATPHIGPMAQDFKAAFYPNRDDKSITTLEFDGVELAAIQGLNEKVEAHDRQLQEQLTAKDQELETVKQELATQKALATRLEARFNALEKSLAEMRPELAEK